MTTIPTARSTRLLEIDTATRVRTVPIRHAAGNCQHFPLLVPLLVPRLVQLLLPRILVQLLPLLQLRLQPQPNLRTTRAASVREIVPVTFFASCVSTRMTWNKRRSLITNLSNLFPYFIIQVASRGIFLQSLRSMTASVSLFTIQKTIMGQPLDFCLCWLI